MERWKGGCTGPTSVEDPVLSSPKPITEHSAGSKSRIRVRRPDSVEAEVQLPKESRP